MKNFILRLYCIATLIFFFGSWVNAPQIISFHNGQINDVFMPDSQGIKIEVKPYSSLESKQILEKDLLDLGFQPLQVTITNNTPNSYSVCQSSFDLKTVKPKDILKKTSRSEIPRRIGYSIAGFFFWPFTIPSIIDGIISQRMKKNYFKKLEAKSIKEEVIAPYTTVTRVLFVKKKDVLSEFDVSLIELDTLKPYLYHYKEETP